MATITIDALPNVASPALTDTLPEDQSGVTYNVTLLQIYSLFGFSSNILGMTFGGTGANLTPVLGASVYSTASSLALTSAMTNGQILIGSTGLAPSLGTITSGPGISITNGAGTITISSTNPGSWIDQTTTPVAMTTNTGYTSDDGSNLITFSLPTVSSIGDFIEINGKGSGLWTITQAAGQQIHSGSSSTTSGTGGSLSSTIQYSNVRLRCLTASTIWTIVSSVGTLTIV
jgi:hypothetical protein